MSRNEKIYELLVEAIKERHPKFKLVAKQSSKFMLFLNFFVRLFNDRFMTRYITVIGSTVYVPESRLHTKFSLWPTLAHEWQHLEQAKKQTGFVHILLYLFPQILALFSFMALFAIWFSNWWLISLLCLVFLAPIPAYFRMRKELEGYMVNVYIAHLEGYLTDVYITSLTRHFLTSFYYFMWPFRSHLLKKLRKEAKAVEHGHYDADRVCGSVKKILQEVDGGLLVGR